MGLPSAAKGLLGLLIEPIESCDTDTVGVLRIFISVSTVGIPVAEVVVVYVLDMRRPDARVLLKRWNKKQRS